MLSNLVLLAQAAPAAPAGPGGILGNPMIMMVLMFVMMYFLLIRPQRQRQKEQERLLSSVKVGDHVIMNGGEHGIITSTKDKSVMVKIADNVKVEYERSAIASISKKSDVVEATAA
ncbi:preprotein translocase subunit YajC [Brevifollis gellanilyticus]|uniref:Sec translocon accessory complex subunit YajC n=1 Tax=Brevifollis gellanilyticus TaxID=748831 RepID=A0A512MGH0_9BACT|nr:preprotein translocase subunit YajC [Brevifollis gellanilyticus]GEP45818.1 preprotein translocase subunit YajC [Brevifollis gellanilyticus]